MDIETRNEREHLINVAVRRARGGNTQASAFATSNDTSSTHADDITFADGVDGKHPFTLDVDTLDDPDAILL